jgi:HAD superfamily hydrolase (TIGR01549 family)
MSDQPFRALLFDLFGTVVHFAPSVPAVEAATSQWRTAMHWLQETAERELPRIRFDDLLTALMEVTQEIVHQRPPEYREVPSRERFRRALLRLGIDAEQAPPVAERLSLAHMSYLASTTMLPPAHLDVLERLASRFCLGLVSNFDHGPTARRILADHGITRLFAAVVISDGFGRRKPHPEIFAAALRELDVALEEALFIGDSVSDDVVGAQNAGLKVVWLNPKRRPLPPDVKPPEYELTELRELPVLLDLPE